MRITTIFLFLILSSLAFAQSNFKIQTVNLNAEAGNQELAKIRYPLWVDYFRAADLDVILLQEVWHLGSAPNIAVQIARDLNYDVAYLFEDGVTGIYDTATAILSKKNLHFRNQTATKLPHSAFTIGDGTNFWACLGECNVLVGGTIDLPNGKPATVWSTHLSSTSASHRTDQAVFALEYMKDYIQKSRMDWASTASFFGGDLNSDPDSDIGILFQQTGGFTDSWQVAHPHLPGLTMINDPLSPEYNPMIHSAGQFPEQYGNEPTSRLDYIYFKNLPKTEVGSERMFTSPIGRIWMSDHYSILSVFNFDGVAQNLPDADSDMKKLGAPTYFNFTQKIYDSPLMTKDFDVYSLRGFTVANRLKEPIEFVITSNASQVYNSNFAELKKSEIASFNFFLPGNFRYRIIYKDPLYDESGGQLILSGTIHVH